MNEIFEDTWREELNKLFLVKIQLSRSRKPSREFGMLRNTRENMSIPGHVFDRQHA